MSRPQDQATPTDIKLKREDGSLAIAWKDGHVSRLDLALVRLRCPCATCNTERQKKAESAELFPILKSDPGHGPPQATGAKLIGNYALQILWSDGHNTGIYDFRYLRELGEAGDSPK